MFEENSITIDLLVSKVEKGTATKKEVGLVLDSLAYYRKRVKELESYIIDCDSGI